MSVRIEREAASLSRQEWAERFRYGWRYVKKIQPDGTETLEEVPLTLEDTLHPQEGDFIPVTDLHMRDCHYLREVFEARLADDPHAVVLCDHLIDWKHPTIGSHAPDVCVFHAKRKVYRGPGTYNVTKEQAKPLLVVEVTSPENRSNDVEKKLDHYYRVGVPLFVIVDSEFARSETLPREPVLLGYRAGPTGYEAVPLDDAGRLYLPPVDLWLGIEDDHVRCYDPSGTPVGNYVEVDQAAREAEQRAEREALRRRQAEEQVESEALRRRQAEERIRELEAELRRRNEES